jgi:hypothetical protein
MNHFRLLTLSLIILIAVVRPASAQAALDADDAPPGAAEGNGASRAPDTFSDTWKFALGGGVINGARYPGSRDDFTRGLPVLSISYDRFFVGAVPDGGTPAGAGAYLLRTEHWAIGLDIGGDFRKPRRATDDPILRGWDIVHRTRINMGERPVCDDFLRHRRRSKRDRGSCAVSGEKRDQHGRRVGGRHVPADGSLVAGRTR